MDPSVALDVPVTLVIRAPNQKYDDQTINCFLNWTVEQLKTHISKVYPSKPLSRDQRLVYSGRLLLDHLQLKDVLRKQDDYHMVHLVCTSRSPPASPKPTSTKCSSVMQDSSSSLSLGSDPATHSSNEDSLTTSGSSNSEGPRHRNVPHGQTNAVYSQAFPHGMQGNVGSQVSVPQGVPVGIPAYPMFNSVQMLWWQMYARQYYMQYQAAVSAQGPETSQATAPVSSSPVVPQPVPQNEPAAAANVVPQENRPVNQNIQMNAQGGPVMNDEDFNRDWLDWLYTFSRAAILLSIVYFYSSFSRFIMVVGAMLLVYLHQAGWFPFRQDGVQQQAVNELVAEVNNDGQEPDRNIDMHEMERIMDDGVDDNTDSGDEVAENGTAAQHPGLVASVWSFIITFFTSLIPEGPPQVVN